MVLMNPNSFEQLYVPTALFGEGHGFS
ncbi:MAG: hypothetical protein IPP33_06135 [Flavobacteriales bacterium]|nr:hypothetical protein [Flavobacteriales bacterium]